MIRKEKIYVDANPQYGMMSVYVKKSESTLLKIGTIITKEEINSIIFKPINRVSVLHLSHVKLDDIRICNDLEYEKCRPKLLKIEKDNYKMF